MQIHELAGTDLGDHVAAYDDRDVILYALAVGASYDDLTLVYERDLRVLPTYATALGLWAVEAAGQLGVYDPTMSLHAAQTLEVSGELPTSGQVAMTGHVANVWDKGAAAMIDIQVTSDTFTAGYAIYVKGMGDFGGDRGPSSRSEEPTGPPHASSTFTTGDEQAVLYRLTGDRHPVHVDPDIAAAGGFPRPILHGLCTFGVAVREAAGLVGAHPADLRAAEARLAAPVIPGQTLQVDTWGSADDVRFVTAVGDTTVLKSGLASFTEGPTHG